MPVQNTTSKRKKTTAKVVEVPQVDTYGRQQPQQLDFEAAVLGAMLIEQDAYSEVSQFMRPEVFYDHRHQLIYEAVQSLSSMQKPVDILTVPQWLESQGKLEEAGGKAYIAMLTQNVITSAHIEYQAKILLQKYQARELITYASHLLAGAFDETTDVAELMETAEGRLFELSTQTSVSPYTQINPIITQAFETMREAAQNENGMSGLPSGYPDLDKFTNGWQKDTLVVIAARPAMGKTAFALSMIKNMAVDRRIPVAFFSLEMSNLELVNRLIMNTCEMPGNKIKSGQLRPDEWRQMDARVTQLQDAPIYVDDTPSLSVFELRTKARRLVREHGVKMIVIDYLQLMNASGMSFGNRQEEVSTISKNLKALAKELHIPIVALSQLNRGVENREGNQAKRPQLSDLRESGAIEQDADIVCFIHRPEYYKIYFDEETQQDLTGMAEIIIGKHRAGGTGIVYLRFQGEYARFSNKNANSAADIPAPGEEGSFASSMMSSEEMGEIERMQHSLTIPSQTGGDVPF